jgi:hypothetical protein
MKILEKKMIIKKFTLSYVDYRPTTNAAILWYMGHTKGRPCMGG